MSVLLLLAHDTGTDADDALVRAFAVWHRSIERDHDRVCGDRAALCCHTGLSAHSRTFPRTSWRTRRSAVRDARSEKRLVVERQAKAEQPPT